MKEGYKYHLFISYSRSGDVPDWLRNHFLPVLENCLDTELNEEPQIFVDTDIETGSPWPDALAEALHRSCFLLSIWTPRYFRSKWCLAEWRTMLAREKQLGSQAQGDAPWLTYPVIFGDGEHFPDKAKRIQFRRDLSEFAYPYPQFRTTEKYLAFHDVMREVAGELASRFAQIPTWDPNWESMKPDPEEPSTPRFPRI